MSKESDKFVKALKPVVESLGASIVPTRSSRTGDRPVEWEGETVAYLRTSDLHSALERMVGALEREFGAPLAELPRLDKQAAVRRLDEQGAFLLRGAVENVSDRMHVSKVTLYSYLNAIGN